MEFQENQTVLVGAETITCEDGPIIFNSLGSLRLHEQNICEKVRREAYRFGFRMGGIAVACVITASALLWWVVLR